MMAGGRKERKILLVDDEDYNLTALKIILQYHIKLDVDRVCHEAINGHEALLSVMKNVEQNNSQLC